MKAYALESVGFVKPDTVKVIVPGAATKVVKAPANVNSRLPEFHVNDPAAPQPTVQALLKTPAEETVMPEGTFIINEASLGTIFAFVSVN